jgi:hypothetical protein
MPAEVIQQRLTRGMQVIKQGVKRLMGADR